MFKIPILVENKFFPLLLVICLITASGLSCSQLLGSPSETPLSSPTQVASETSGPLPSPTTTLSPSETPTPSSTPSRSLYSNPTMGLNLMYPSDWTIDDGEDFVAFTRPDGWAQISVGWYILNEGQSITGVADLLVGVRVEDVSEPLVFYVEHEGGDPVEFFVQGDDSAGVEWIYHFVVADSGERVLVIETVSTVEDQEALEPIFEEIILSMEKFP